MMAMASTPKVVLGSIAFGIFWVVAVFPAVPFLPIGRTAGSLLGAMLMVIFQVMTPDQAYSDIDLPILGLLFGTMVVSTYLERADMFKYLGRFLSWKSNGGKDLLCRICLISAISSALFTNDTSCIVLTDFVLKIAKQNNLQPHPFLLALASSANIGSATTPIGNPQNLIIAVQGKISFWRFFVGILPAMAVGIMINAAILLGFFWKVLSTEKIKDVDNQAVEIVTVDDKSLQLNSLRSEGVDSSIGVSLDKEEIEDCESCADKRIDVAESDRLSTSSSKEIQQTDIADVPRKYTTESTAINNEAYNHKWKRLLWKICVYLVTIGMLISFLMGLDMSWTAITAALTLMMLDFRDASPCLDKVSYSLLVFFCGMFITTSGFNNTGIPGFFWNLIEPYARIDRISGVAVLAFVILVLSNVASNVPTVLLLGARIAASATAVSPAQETKAWLILAWVSTVAGNFSLLGSAANLIVVEQARRSRILGYTLSFWSHLRFGVPSTIIVTAIGLLLIKSYC